MSLVFLSHCRRDAFAHLYHLGLHEVNRSLHLVSALIEAVDPVTLRAHPLQVEIIKFALFLDFNHCAFMTGLSVSDGRHICRLACLIPFNGLKAATIAFQSIEPILAFFGSNCLGSDVCSWQRAVAIAIPLSFAPGYRPGCATITGSNGL